jgi:predicted amidohydrolase
VRVALVAVQLDIGPEMFASADAYRSALDDAAASALAPVAGADARLVVFPELAGHLALYALAPAPARRAKTLATALAAAAVRRPLEVLRGAATTFRLGPRHAILAALAPDGERWWKSVFGPLARRHDAYVVAGSHLRLGGSGELTNASLLYAPDGRLVATTDKVNLVPGVEDAAKGGLGLSRGDAGALPVVDTAFGKLCTLIGYDAASRPRTAEERFQPLAPGISADVIANPAANPSGIAATLLEHPCARFAVTAHLSGRVLDLHFDGQSQILERSDAGVRVLGHANAVVGL